MQTLHVNLWGGPGMGKTGVAQQVSGELKARGIRADYVPEYAKELVRAGIILAYDQLEILAEQHRREKLCEDALQVVVTDSPLPLSLYHCADQDRAAVEQLIDNRMRGWKVVNYFLERDLSESYETEGRYEDVEGALAKHAALQDILKRRDPSYTTVATKGASSAIVADVVTWLRLHDPLPEAA